MGRGNGAACGYRLFRSHKPSLFSPVTNKIMWHLTLLGDEIDFFRGEQRETIKFPSIKARLLLARVALQPIVAAATKTPNDWEGQVETLLTSPILTTALLPVMWIPSDYDEAARKKEMSGMRTDWNTLLGSQVIASKRARAHSQYWLDPQLVSVDAHKFLQHPLQRTTSSEQITNLLDSYDKHIGTANSNHIVLRAYAKYDDGDVDWIAAVESFLQEVYLEGLARLAQETPLSLRLLLNRLKKFEARGVNPDNIDLLEQVREKLNGYSKTGKSNPSGTVEALSFPAVSQNQNFVPDEARRNRVRINADGASFSSLSQAIENAIAGDVLYLAPGIYEESVTIDKPLRLVGTEKRGEVVLRASGATPLTFRAPSDNAVGRTGISNITVRQLGRRKACGIAIESGNPCIEKCEVSAEGTACIQISNAATPLIVGSDICHGRGPGVLFCPGTAGTLNDNTIHSNKEAGVEIVSTSHIARPARPTLTRNSICNNEGDGVLIRDCAQAYLEGNSIYGNRFAGISIRDGANPMVGKDNSILRNLADGIFASENGRGTIEDSIIANNLASGISVKTGASLVLRRNRIKEGRRNGVYIHESGSAILESNDLNRNGGSGLIVRQESQIFLLDNHFGENQEYGCLAKEKSMVTLVEETNTFESNLLGDVQIELDSVSQTVAKRG